MISRFPEFEIDMGVQSNKVFQSADDKTANPLSSSIL